VCNKIDIVPLDELSDENKKAMKIFDDNKIPLLSMSTVTEEGVMGVKETVSSLSVEDFLSNTGTVINFSF
jgi:hypothetical protein